MSRRKNVSRARLLCRQRVRPASERSRDNYARERSIMVVTLFASFGNLDITLAILADPCLSMVSVFRRSSLDARAQSGTEYRETATRKKIRSRGKRSMKGFEWKRNGEKRRPRQRRRSCRKFINSSR
ncbi:hypothetical protein PUN28_018800 [Cardiocondyla obscurior]|uniref:Ribosomal protein L34 n=1 Tax=Cardiocondyla obscurior TaxID=286306 RepID=A0AAW2EG68_9HYME